MATPPSSGEFERDVVVIGGGGHVDLLAADEWFAVELPGECGRRPRLVRVRQGDGVVVDARPDGVLVIHRPVRAVGGGDDASGDGDESDLGWLSGGAQGGNADGSGGIVQQTVQQIGPAISTISPRTPTTRP